MKNNFISNYFSKSKNKEHDNMEDNAITATKKKVIVDEEEDYNNDTNYFTPLKTNNYESEYSYAKTDISKTYERLKSTMSIDNSEKINISSKIENKELDSLPDFLNPINIMDKNKNKPNDKDYDPETLYIPTKDFENFTP